MWGMVLLGLTVWVAVWRDASDDLWPQRLIFNLANHPPALYQLDVSSGDQHLLATNATNTIAPLQWSSDGQMIAYTGFISPLTNIYLALPNRPLAPLTNDDANRVYGSEQPSWSPDNAAIAYARGFSYVDQSGNYRYLYRLYVQHLADGSRAATALSTDNTFRGIAWSPRGDWIAVRTITDQTAVWLYDPAGEADPRLISGDREPGVFAWARDGASLYFLEQTDTTPKLYRFAVDTGQLTDWGLPPLAGGQITMLDISPCQEAVLLAATRHGLQVFDPKTATLNQLSATEAFAAQWTSDCRSIVYQAYRGPLQLITADGTPLAILTDEAVAYFDVAPLINSPLRGYGVLLALLLILLGWTGISSPTSASIPLFEVSL